MEFEEYRDGNRDFVSRGAQFPFELTEQEKEHEQKYGFIPPLTEEELEAVYAKIASHVRAIREKSSDGKKNQLIFDRYFEELRQSAGHEQRRRSEDLSLSIHSSEDRARIITASIEYFQSLCVEACGYQEERKFATAIFQKTLEMWKDMEMRWRIFDGR